MPLYPVFLTGLMVVSVASFSPRSDYRTSIAPSVNTHWGSWGVDQWCPYNTWATGFSLKVERSQGRGDDTALNGIKLLCTSGSSGRPSGGSEIHSSVGPWGGWTTYQYCPSGNYIVGARARSERSQGGGRNDDDTAGNDYDFECRGSGSGIHDLYGDGMYWGSWSSWTRCPSGQAICGLKTRVEGSQGSGDDTALNNAQFYCCAQE